MQINVKSNIKDYSIDFYDNFDFLSDFSSIKEKFFIVDKNVWEYYSETLLKYISEEQLYILPISEDRKNLDTVQTLYKILAQKAAKKNITLISIGGGITQDITGFLASTLYRGINWIYIPSTLLSQADSCLGSAETRRLRREELRQRSRKGYNVVFTFQRIPLPSHTVSSSPR